MPSKNCPVCGRFAKVVSEFVKCHNCGGWHDLLEIYEFQPFDEDMKVRLRGKEDGEDHG